jgi:hypothetical protein
MPPRTTPCIYNPFWPFTSKGLSATALHRNWWGQRYDCLSADHSLEVLEKVGINAMLAGERWRIWGEQSGEGFE